MFLLDTNVVSEAVRPRPDERVLAWLAAHSGASAYLSALTLGELEQGIVRSPSPQRAERLREWLEAVLLPQFAGRVLALDVAVMRTWGRLTGDALQRGMPVGFADSLLAATAVTYGLTLVTRNVRDFEALPVATLNPWDT